MSFADRKKQPAKSNPNRIVFPKDANEAAGWSRVVRFIRIDDENHETLKYVRHKFPLMDGQGPYVDPEGNTRERNGQQFAYCMGSPSNPFSQDSVVEMDEEGVAECRKIILPNNTPLHDIDGGGEVCERALVWSWSTSHVAIIDRKPTFFDKLLTWLETFNGNPWYYSKERPGFDVIIQTIPKGGNFYDYQFSSPPPTEGRPEIADVMQLLKQQRPEVMKQFNPARTAEKIRQELGIGGGPTSAAPPPRYDFGGGPAAGSSARLDEGLGDDDEGDEL